MMNQKLTKIGTELVLIFDDSITEHFKLDLETVVEMTLVKNGLNLRFSNKEINRASNEDVMKALDNINKRYGKMLKNLAK
jgi:hypothetical protein